MKLDNRPLMRHAIVQGLRPDIRRDVLIMRPSTLEELGEAAANGESNARLAAAEWRTSDDAVSAQLAEMRSADDGHRTRRNRRATTTTRTDHRRRQRTNTASRADDDDDDHGCYRRTRTTERGSRRRPHAATSAADLRGMRIESCH